MLERPGTPRCDHRDPDAVDDGAGELEVVARARAVAVHAGEEDLARPGRLHGGRPVDGVEARRRPTAVRVDLPATTRVVRDAAARVDRDDDTLRAEALGRLADEVRPRDRRGVDGHLVGTGLQQRADVVDGAHAAANREWHEDALGGAGDDVEDDRPLLVRCRDVEEAELVGALRVVAGGDLHRIARVDQVDEAHALDDAAVLHVEARDDAACEHQAASAAARASARRIAPV